MKRILLIVGGVMQLLLALLHAFMFRGIAALKIEPALKDTGQIFNAAVLTTVLFFAYVSFFEVRTLTGRRFGRIVLLFIAIFYLQRGLVELFLRGVQPLSLAICLGLALLYVLVMVPEKPRPAQPAVAEPEIPASVP